MAHPAVDDINMSQAQSRSYAFHFFFAAGKGCLFPFLTIYLRFLGLRPMQVGAVMCVKAVATFMGAPCGGRCATRCRKQRLMLMFSIFILLSSYLLMTLIPSSNHRAEEEYCNTTGSHQSGINKAVFGHLDSHKDISTTTAKAPTVTVALVKDNSKSVTTILPSELIRTIPYDEPNMPKSTPLSTSTTPKHKQIKNKSKKPSSAVHTPVDKKQSAIPDNANEDQLSPEEIKILKSMGYSVDDLSSMTEGEIDTVIAKLAKLMKTSATPGTKTKNGQVNHIIGDLFGKTRKKRHVEHELSNSSLSSENNQGFFKAGASKLWKLLEDFKVQLEAQGMVFAAVLAIVGLSELLSSPVESIADEVWFDFLDGIDMVEKYGQQKLWACLGVMLFPVVVTGIIYNTPCLILDMVPHNQIHFYAFALLMGIAFICAFVYPIYTESRKVIRKQNACKGLMILFGDCRAALVFMSVIVMGLTYSCMYNWMFWRIQDLGGTEIIMGVCILVSAFSELVIQICHRWFISKVSHAGAIILALILMSLRFIYYSFITSPWLMVVGEAFHGLTVTLMWHAIQGYPQFRLNPHVMDRSAYCVMVALYSLLGLGVGSALSGYIYEQFGMAILYQGAAVLLAAWCLLFGVVYRCAPHQQKVRYAKLLQEDEQSDEEGVIYEDDWLEVAMKSKQ